ncbi:hypothetical protein ACIF8T_21895 [Streptomyces sp. NPDC085946]
MNQLYLFPLADIQTKGYAQPESRWGNTDDEATEVEVEQQAEAA